MKTCREDPCARSDIKGHGMCGMHLQAWLRADALNWRRLWRRGSARPVGSRASGQWSAVAGLDGARGAGRRGRRSADAQPATSRSSSSAVRRASPRLAVGEGRSAITSFGTAAGRSLRCPPRQHRRVSSRASDVATRSRSDGQASSGASAAVEPTVCGSPRRSGYGSTSEIGGSAGSAANGSTPGYPLLTRGRRAWTTSFRAALAGAIRPRTCRQRT